MICFFFARIKNGEIPLFGHVLLGSPPPLHQSNKSNNTSSQKKRERKMMDRIFRRRLLLRTYVYEFLNFEHANTHVEIEEEDSIWETNMCLDDRPWRNGEMVVSPNLLILISWWPGVGGLQIEFPSVQSRKNKNKVCSKSCS